MADDCNEDDPVCFINRLSAKMSGADVNKYVEDREWVIKNLNRVEKIAKEAKVETEDDFKRIMAMKGALSSTYCYAFNNQKECWEKVGAIENIIGGKLAKYVEKGMLKGDDAFKARYLLWGRRLRDDNFLREQYLKELHAQGRVVKYFQGKTKAGDDRYGYCITGIRKKVGDNVFTVDSRGGQHRTFIDVCSKQAFPVDDLDQEIIQKLNLQVPLITEDEYSITGFGDYKHSARRPAITRDERWKIHDLIERDRAKRMAESMRAAEEKASHLRHLVGKTVDGFDGAGKKIWSHKITSIQNVSGLHGMREGTYSARLDDGKSVTGTEEDIKKWAHD